MASTDYLKYQRKLNTLLAMPLYTGSVKSFGKTFRFLLFNLYQRISEIIVIVVTAAQIWAIPHIYQDMNVLCGCLSSGSHSLQVVLKTAYLRSFKKEYVNHFAKISSLQNEINEFEKLVFETDTSGFVVYHLRQSRYVRVIATIQLLINFASTSAYFLPFVYDSIVNRSELDRQFTPIVVYIGMNINFSPLFQIINITLTVGFFFINLKSVVIDNFILHIIVLHMSQLKYHDNMFKEIQRILQSKTARSGREITKIWIKQHQMLLGLHSGFQKLVSPYLAVEFSYIFFHTCVPAFVITSTFSWTFPQKVAVFFMVGGGITTLFLMSHASDSFSGVWQETGENLYDPDIILKGGTYMEHIYLVIQKRLQRPFHFSALNILPLRCSTFLTILRLIVSYYITLGQLQKMKHNA